MLRALHGQADLHVIVGPLWRNTGLEMEHVEPLADLPEINWHVVCADDPYQFRMDGQSVEGLLDLVEAIAPDITIARSADRVTPGLFPGALRYITEPGAEPFHAPHRWFVLDEHPFHHGIMPGHVAGPADRAAALMAPIWQTLETLYAEPHKGAFREQLGLPADRPVLAVPLQYEHDENFHGVGSPFQYGPEFIYELLDQLDERIVLAITDHPLNAQFLIRIELERIAAKYPDRVRLYPWDKERGSPTSLLVRAADGVLLDQSKCVFLATFFGVPIVHCGDSITADWLRATRLEELGADALANRGLPAPDRAMARRWFGWHFGMRLLKGCDNQPRDAREPRLQSRRRERGRGADRLSRALVHGVDPGGREGRRDTAIGRRRRAVGGLSGALAYPSLTLFINKDGRIGDARMTEIWTGRRAARE